MSSTITETTNVKIIDKIAQYTSPNKSLPAISLEFFPPKSQEGVLVSLL